jgi:hypothetical protein
MIILAIIVGTPLFLFFLDIISIKKERVDLLTAYLALEYSKNKSVSLRRSLAIVESARITW